MSEGNPGAATVLMRMFNEDAYGILNILSLDDMNIRGTQIWYAYKDYCGEDMSLFVQSVESRDIEMIKAINICVAKYDEEKHKVVRFGATARNGREMLSEEEVKELAALPAIRNPKLKTK